MSDKTYEGAFTDRNGNKVNSGDRVVYSLDDRKGVVSDILQDGDAYVKFDVGESGQVKWTNLFRLQDRI